MKQKFFLKILLTLFIGASFVDTVSAAKILINAPSKALSNRQPIVVRVLLDTEQDTLSGISGNFSFPADLFSVESIMTQGSVVSPWVIEPSISEEKYLDNKTHIIFEGIFPGGFSGVRSPYYEGGKAGILFSITLIPNNKGTGTLGVDDIVFNSFSSDAKRLPSEAIFTIITVPQLIGNPAVKSNEPQRVENKSLSLRVDRDELINRNAAYLTLTHSDTFSAVKKIFVVESDTYNGDTILEKEWREVSLPYVLLYQDRTKYIHVKVLYANNTYTIKTLAPVENSKSISGLSRILVGVLALLFVLFFYGHHLLTHLLIFFRKKK